MTSYVAPVQKTETFIVKALTPIAIMAVHTCTFCKWRVTHKLQPQVKCENKNYNKNGTTKLNGTYDERGPTSQRNNRRKNGG